MVPEHILEYAFQFCNPRDYRSVSIISRHFAGEFMKDLLAVYLTGQLKCFINPNLSRGQANEMATKYSTNRYHLIMFIVNGWKYVHGNRKWFKKNMHVIGELVRFSADIGVPSIWQQTLRSGGKYHTHHIDVQFCEKGIRIIQFMGVNKNILISDGLVKFDSPFIGKIPRWYLGCARGHVLDLIDINHYFEVVRKVTSRNLQPVIRFDEFDALRNFIQFTEM